MGEQSERVDEPEGRLVAVARHGVARGVEAGAQQLIRRQRPARRGAGIARVEPARPGRVAGEHAEEGGQVLAVAVADRRRRAPGQQPAVTLHPPAEVDVAGRANALGEAPHRLEGLAADHQVAGRRVAAVVALQPGLAAVEVARARVAGEQRVVVGVVGDRARDRPLAVTGWRVEVAPEQAGRRSAVGVEEQDPTPAGERGAHVAGVIGGSLPCRADHPRRLAERRRGDPLVGVVGDDQLVARLGVERAQLRKQPPGRALVPVERDHDADGGPSLPAACCLLWPSQSA